MKHICKRLCHRAQHRVTPARTSAALQRDRPQHRVVRRGASTRRDARATELGGGVACGRAAGERGASRVLDAPLVDRRPRSAGPTTITCSPRAASAAAASSRHVAEEAAHDLLVALRQLTRDGDRAVRAAHVEQIGECRCRPVRRLEAARSSTSEVAIDTRVRSARARALAGQESFEAEAARRQARERRARRATRARTRNDLDREPASTQARTSCSPGSEMPGMPGVGHVHDRASAADRVDDAHAPRPSRCARAPRAGDSPAATPTRVTQRARPARVLGRDDVGGRAAPRPHAATGRRGCRSVSRRARAQRRARRRSSPLHLDDVAELRASTARTRPPAPRSRSTNATTGRDTRRGASVVRVQHEAVAVAERDVDREPHPEGVHLPARPEHEHAVEPVAADQPAPAQPPRSTATSAAASTSSSTHQPGHRFGIPVTR